MKNITYTIETKEGFNCYEAYIKANIDGKEYKSVNCFEAESKSEMDWLIKTNYFSDLNFFINNNNLEFEVTNTGLTRDEKEDLLYGINDMLIYIRNNSLKAYSIMEADETLNITILP